MIWQQRDRSLTWCSIRYVKDDAATYPAGAKSASWGRIGDILGRTGKGCGLNITTDIGNQLEWLQRNSPGYLLTYPSNLKALLDAGTGRGNFLPQLQQVVTIAESLPSGLREQCLEQWGVRICDLYSATEIGYLAIQAPVGDHYLVQDEVARVELLDDDNRAVGPGDIGRVVVTPLHNFAMPLIRYAIGDYAERGGTSPCGRTLPVISRILGRVRNMLTYPNGTKAWPLFSDNKFRDIAPVRQFRVIQHTLDRLELQVAAERTLTDQDRTALADILRERVRHPFAIDVTEHAEIARGAGGKYEDFRSELGRA